MGILANGYARLHGTFVSVNTHGKSEHPSSPKQARKRSQCIRSFSDLTHDMRTLEFTRRLLFIFVGILLFHFSQAQQNIMPGQIITLDQDTVQGFIDYRNWEKNPTEIEFQKTLSDAPQRYAPSDIKGFMVADEHYVSATVDMEISPIKTGSLSYNSKIELEKTSTFLQTLIQASESLYYLRDQNGKDQFYIWQGEQYELLLYKKYYGKQHGNRIIIEDKKYIRQLNIYLSDCPSIAPKLQNTLYSKKSLEKLFLYYYECNQSGLKFHKKVESTSLEFGLLAGILISSLQFKSEDFTFLSEAVYSNSLYGTTGVFLDVILPRNQRKWSLNNELIFTSYDIDGQYLKLSNDGNYNYISTEIRYSYLKMNNMVSFRYPIKNTFIHANAGISNGLAISGENHLKEKTVYNSVTEVLERPILSYIKKYERGYIFGLGAQYKKYSFETRVEYSNGFSPYRFIYIPVTRYYGLLKYRF